MGGEDPHTTEIRLRKTAVKALDKPNERCDDETTAKLSLSNCIAGDFERRVGCR